MISPPLPKTISTIYVGFSGGADSTALLLLLADKYPDKVHAVHFNHGLRVESVSEQLWCDQFCRRLNIKFTTIDLNVPANQLSREATEEAARRLRLKEWCELAGGKSDAIVALAHHRDDINENFFIRLMRGSGLSGLIGLREWTNVKDVLFWRPLLKFPKSRLLDYLQTQGIEQWCEDPSNQESLYRRNAIRNRLLPLFSDIAGGTHGLEHSLKIITKEATFLEQLAENEFAKVDGYKGIDNWQKIPTALLPRVFRLFMHKATGTDFVPTGATIERLVNEIKNASPAEKLIPLDNEKMLAVSTHGLKVIARNEEIELGEVTWNPLQHPTLKFGDFTIVAELVDKIDDKSGHCQFFDLDQLNQPLVVRTFQPGDRIKAFGSGMMKKLKKVFIDQKIPRSERASIPLVTCSGNIIWTAGVIRSNHALVTDTTQKILKLKLLPQVR